jgi:hypothetical protein
LTWFLQHVSRSGGSSDAAAFAPCFAIDRAAAKTPRRNQQCDDALAHAQRFFAFASSTSHYLERKLGGALDGPARAGLDWAQLSRDAAFVPVLPIFENGRAPASTGPADPSTAGSDASGSEPGSAVGSLISVADAGKFLQEEAASLSAALAALTFPDAGLFTKSEAAVVVVSRHCGRVCEALQESLGFVEGMLYSQLYAAIGHEVKPAEFGQFMRFHHGKLFATAAKPKPLSTAVRRSPAHSPEGAWGIETAERGAPAGAPVETFSATRAVGRAMGFSLNAATRVELASQEVHLHGWLRHTFAGQEAGPSGAVQLVARARQFSSFVVIVGRITDATTLDPQHAFLVQNRDGVHLPLTKTRTTAAHLRF